MIWIPLLLAPHMLILLLSAVSVRWGWGYCPICQHGGSVQLVPDVETGLLCGQHWWLRHRITVLESEVLHD